MISMPLYYVFSVKVTQEIHFLSPVHVNVNVSVNAFYSGLRPLFDRSSRSCRGGIREEIKISNLLINLHNLPFTFNEAL